MRLQAGSENVRGAGGWDAVYGGAMNEEDIAALAQQFVDEYMHSPELRAGIIILLGVLQQHNVPEEAWGAVLKQIGLRM
jgi:hypothetical protein